MSLLKSNKVKTESKTLHFDMKKRRALSAIIGFSYAFIFFFAGTLDIFVSNNALIFVPFSRVILIAATAFLLAGACLTILFFLIPHKLYTQGILISLGIFVAGYLQGTFLNPNLGGLTGDEVVWGDFLSVTIVTSLIWVVLIFAPSILISPRISDAKSFAKITYAVCGIVCGMQAVGLIGNITTSDVFVSKNFGQYLNADKEFEVSSQKNIMLFIVDRLDGQYVNEVIEDDPSFFERLDGFTQFDNATSSFSWTYPSATYINTGVFRLCDIPATQYFEEAWGGSEYISLLKENNYELNYSMSLGFAYSDVGQLIDIADNLMEEEIQNKFFPTMTSFLNLSAYRYAPMLLKPTLWMAEVDFPYTVSTGTKVACDDDALFYRRFLENGLTVQKKTNNYQYIHFNGSHAPFIMDENALPSEDTGLVKQTKGCFKIIFEYIDEMKKLGLYKDATIIITGDHGYFGGLPATVGLFVKPSGSEGTPLVQNHAPVTHDNLHATILQSEGLDYSSFNDTFFDIPEDLETVRYSYDFESNFDGGRHRLWRYEIHGDARNPDNWKHVGFIEDVYKP